MDDAVEQAVEQQMIQKADEFIDEMIPPEGMDTFGQPEGGGFFGLGQDDLDTTGTAAFAGILGEVLDLNSTSAFNGMGALAAISFKKFGNKLKSFAKSRANVARKALSKVAGAHKRALGRARNLVRKGALTRNVFQREKLLRGAKAAAGQAARYKTAGKQLAREAANPKISRAEARVAMRPVIKGMAKGVAKSGKAVIQRAANIASRVPGGKQALAVAAKSGALTKRIASGLQKGIASSITPKGLAARVKSPVLKKLATPIRSLFGGKKKKRFGLFGLGEAGDNELVRAVTSELERAGMGNMMFFSTPGSGDIFGKGETEAIEISSEQEESMIPSEEPTDVEEIMAEEAASQGTTGFLSMADMDTVTQDPELVDITTSWESDEAFGDPMGF